jgi:hypothetical protein
VEEISRPAPRSVSSASRAPPDLGGLLSVLLGGPPVNAPGAQGSAPGGLANIMQIADQLFGPNPGAIDTLLSRTLSHCMAMATLNLPLLLFITGLSCDVIAQIFDGMVSRWPFTRS